MQVQGACAANSPSARSFRTRRLLPRETGRLIAAGLVLPEPREFLALLHVLPGNRPGYRRQQRRPPPPSS